MNLIYNQAIHANQFSFFPIRWLSLGKVLDRLLENWAPLQDFFQSEATEESRKRKRKSSTVDNEQSKRTKRGTIGNTNPLSSKCKPKGSKQPSKTASVSKMAISSSDAEKKTAGPVPVAPTDKVTLSSAKNEDLLQHTGSKKIGGSSSKQFDLTRYLFKQKELADKYSKGKTSTSSADQGLHTSTNTSVSASSKTTSVSGLQGKATSTSVKTSSKTTSDSRLQGKATSSSVKTSSKTTSDSRLQGKSTSTSVKTSLKTSSDSRLKGRVAATGTSVKTPSNTTSDSRLQGKASRVFQQLNNPNCKLQALFLKATLPVFENANAVSLF